MPEWVALTLAVGVARRIELMHALPKRDTRLLFQILKLQRVVVEPRQNPARSLPGDRTAAKVPQM